MQEKELEAKTREIEAKTLLLKGKGTGAQLNQHRCLNSSLVR